MVPSKCNQIILLIRINTIHKEKEVIVYMYKTIVRPHLVMSKEGHRYAGKNTEKSNYVNVCHN